MNSSQAWHHWCNTHEPTIDVADQELNLMLVYGILMYMHVQLVVLFHIVDPGKPFSLIKIFNNNILFHLRIPPSGEILS